MIEVLYVGDELPVLDDMDLYIDNSIFLAGPTPRSTKVESWRKEALRILEEIGFKGTVFVPETSKWGWLGDYDRQVHWEWDALGLASCTLFWVPRDLETMPAFTTNIEFGFMMALRPESIVFGAPEGAPKTRYMTTCCAQIARFHRAMSYSDGYDDGPDRPISQATTLRECLMLAAARAHDDTET